MSLKLICWIDHYAKHGDQHGKSKTTDLGADEGIFGRDIGDCISVSKVAMGSDVRSNSNLASGLKSRPRNCPYTLVARRSGVRVIEGRELCSGQVISDTAIGCFAANCFS